jgi:hypothetical protein
MARLTWHGDAGLGQQGREGLGRRASVNRRSIWSSRGQLHHRRAVELAVVGGQPHLARLLDDGARHLHLAVVEVAQRAVGLDAEMPISPMSTLNWR